MRLGDLSTGCIDALGVAALVVISGLTYVTGVRPYLLWQDAVRERQDALARSVEEYERVGRQVQAAEERLSKARHQLADAPLRLLGVDQTNTRVKTLTDLAAGLGLEINEIRPGRPEPDARYVRVPVRVTGGGAYRACMLFIHGLRRQFPDMGLSGLELSGDPSGDDVAVRFAFDLVWYAAPAVRASADPGREP